MERKVRKDAESAKDLFTVFPSCRSGFSRELLAMFHTLFAAKAAPTVALNNGKFGKQLIRIYEV